MLDHVKRELIEDINKNETIYIHSVSNLRNRIGLFVWLYLLNFKNLPRVYLIQENGTESEINLGLVFKIFMKSKYKLRIALSELDH